MGIEDATIKTIEGDEPIMESSFFLDIHAKVEPADVIKSSVNVTTLETVLD